MCLQYHTTHPSSLPGKGVSQFHLKDYKGSLESYRSVLKKNPSCPASVRTAIGLCQHNLGNVQKVCAVLLLISTMYCSSVSSSRCVVIVADSVLSASYCPLVACCVWARAWDWREEWPGTTCARHYYPQWHRGRYCMVSHAHTDFEPSLCCHAQRDLLDKNTTNILYPSLTCLCRIWARGLRGRLFCSLVHTKSTRPTQWFLICLLSTSSTRRSRNAFCQLIMIASSFSES